MTDTLQNFLLQHNIIPEKLIRLGIRHRLRKTLQQESTGLTDQSELFALIQHRVETMRHMPIAVDEDKANAQHYEIPSQFYQAVLGPHLKYSCCHWDKAVDLAQAEEEMVALVCERAGLSDGQTVLDLGCGWGSFSLYAASRYPQSRFLAISNAPSQKEYIDGQIAKHGLTNLEVRTANVAELELAQQFDRIVSVEMFEHMKNYQALLHKLAGWMNSDSRLFVHIFAHHSLLYHFEIRDDSWMSKYFFSGGTMPSNHMLYYFSDDMHVTDHWVVNGMHYARTAEAWLNNMDARRESILELFKSVYGAGYRLWFAYWRLFFLACAETFAFRQGNEWHISHYVLKKNCP